MRVASCSDCGRSLDLTVERHFRVSPAFAVGGGIGDGGGAGTGDKAETGIGDRGGTDDAEETVFCLDCGVVRLNSDPSLPAGAVEAHAPTGARR